jgi:hypothetical protein
MNRAFFEGKKIQLPLYNYQPQQSRRFGGTNEARSLALISKVIV